MLYLFLFLRSSVNEGRLQSKLRGLIELIIFGFLFFQQTLETK
jgi:hypothetical protein